MTRDEWLSAQPDLPEEVANVVRRAWGIASAEGVDRVHAMMAPDDGQDHRG